MVMYKIIFSHEADKDKKKLKAAGLEGKAKETLNVISIDPYDKSYSFEKLKGNLDKYFSRRINIQNRLVYSVDEENKEIFVVRMCPHYDKL